MTARPYWTRPPGLTRAEALDAAIAYLREQEEPPRRRPTPAALPEELEPGRTAAILGAVQSVHLRMDADAHEARAAAELLPGYRAGYHAQAVYDYDRHGFPVLTPAPELSSLEQLQAALWPLRVTQGEGGGMAARGWGVVAAVAAGPWAGVRLACAVGRWGAR